MATFLHNGDAGTWPLARVRLTQSIGANRHKATFHALVARYGKTDLAQPFDGPPSLTDLKGTDLPRMVAVAQRPGCEATVEGFRISRRIDRLWEHLR